MSKYIIDKDTLTNIADAVRDRLDSKEYITVSDLPEKISSINATKKDPVDFVFKNNELLKVNNAKPFDSFVFQCVNNHPEKITFNNITTLYEAFRNCKYLTSLDLHIDTDETKTEFDVRGTFSNCENLKVFPTINYHEKLNTENMFWNCYNLTTEQLQKYVGKCSNTFLQNCTLNFCHSLKKIPSELIGQNETEYVKLDRFCFGCTTLESLTDMYYPYLEKDKDNFSSLTFSYTNRLKDLTFKINGGYLNTTNDVIDISDFVGYCIDTGNAPSNAKDYILNSSGITWDKRVYNDDTYYALRNDPDWWTDNYRYSRYNHDSAVRTINSLPDTPGGNTIKFEGRAGAGTDGGAINTLTPSEISVAKSKGWTVAFV